MTNIIKPKVLVLSTQCGDWEQLWIDGELRDEGHEIDQNQLWRLGNELGFGPDDVQHKELDNEDERIAQDYGSMPKNGFEKYYSG